MGSDAGADEWNAELAAGFEVPDAVANVYDVFDVSLGSLSSESNDVGPLESVGCCGVRLRSWAKIGRLPRMAALP